MLHYFPPNPEKLGDNLLTLDIAEQFGREHEVTYYATPFVCEVIAKVSSARLQMRHVANMREGAEWAHRLRNNACSIDLLSLNGWVDYPELRPLFGEVPARARLDWFDEQAITDYGIQSFSLIFRDMLNLGSMGPLPPAVWRAEEATRDLIVIAPHSETAFQQYDDWHLLAEALICRGWQVVVVGKQEAALLCPWPSAVVLALDLAGEQLITWLMRASFFIGGATGVTHLADRLGVPSLGLWRVDDRNVFGPRRPSTCTLHSHFCYDVVNQAVKLAGANLTEA